MISKTFKTRLTNGETLYGTFVKLNCPAAVEILGYLGLDFIIIDGEHAPCDQMNLENMIRAADYVKLPAIVRVPFADDVNILKALDMGAAGVQLPGIETASQAKDIVRASKYAPDGRRGLSFAQRSACYGISDRQQYMRDSNRHVLNVVHIENKEMAEQAELLCQIEDIDVLFIGPMDLSQSYGHPGNPAVQEVQAAVAYIIEAARKYQKPLGIFVSTAEAAEKYKNMGVQYLVVGSDVGFLLNGARKMIGNQ